LSAKRTSAFGQLSFCVAVNNFIGVIFRRARASPTGIIPPSSIYIACMAAAHNKYSECVEATQSAVDCRAHVLFVVLMLMARLCSWPALL